MTPGDGARVWLAPSSVYLVRGSTFVVLAVAVRDLPPFLAMTMRHRVRGDPLLVIALPRGDRAGDRIGRPMSSRRSFSGVSCSSPGTEPWRGPSRRSPRASPRSSWEASRCGAASRPAGLRATTPGICVHRPRARLRRARRRVRPLRCGLCRSGGGSGDGYSDCRREPRQPQRVRQASARRRVRSWRRTSM